MKNEIRSMASLSFALVVSILGTFSASCEPARAGDIPAPFIVGGPSNADTQLVWKGVNDAFNSKSPKMADAGEIVRAKSKNLVLWPARESDIECDTTLFDKSPEGGESKFWVQKKPYEGKRFIVRQKPFNWQGDNFNVVLTTTSDTPAEIYKKFDSGEMNELPNGYSSVTCDTWQRPWIFRNPASGKLLDVDTAHPADCLADWTVYESTKDGKRKELCKIRFRKQSEKIAELLPQGPLREISTLLDNIIGKAKENEGTMQQTSRLRNEVARMWGNVLFRPWAMNQPQNSKAQVEGHLKRWQRGARAYKAQYIRLQALYPQAQAALTRYYEQVFRMPNAGASKLAAKNLDIAYRSHFSL